MGITIKVNNVTLCHKGSNGFSKATLPDVCKTPSPGGPVPVPYPNIAFSRTLAKGTRSVKADGGKMCANKGSEFSSSIGDQPGTLGGIKSSTFMKEATWILYSFDVKLEGKGACRLSDKMFHNHGNTINASGENQLNLGPAKDLLIQMLCACNREIQPGANDTCTSLGNKKHDCMEDKKRQHNAAGKKPKLDGEKEYNRRTGKLDPHPRGSRKQRTEELSNLRTKLNAKKARPPRGRGGRGALLGSLIDAIELAQLGKEIAELNRTFKDKIFPDGAIRGADGRIEGIAEYKFRCPAGVKSGKGVSKGTKVPTWRKGQEERTNEFIDAMKQNDPGNIHEKAKVVLVTTDDCK